MTITMSNASPLEHDVAIAEGTKVLGKTPVFGGTRTLTLNLKPGKYSPLSAPSRGTGRRAWKAR